MDPSRITLCAALCLCWTTAASAAPTFDLPPADEDTVGELKWVRARDGDTLAEIARRHGLGYREVVWANPGVPRWEPPAGERILLPSRHLLPAGPREGIVINLPEMRLYYYTEDGQVMILPVGIGREDWRTPLAVTRVVEKIEDPVWYPPASIREEHAAEGDPLPEAVPPGPDNPLGELALRLGLSGYLIHGTNKRYGIGMRVTHGCIRLYPEHIEALYDAVQTGTRVRIVNQPLKAGWGEEGLLIESHPPLQAGDQERELGEMAGHLRKAARRRPVDGVDWAAVDLAVRESRGVPVPVATPADDAL